MDNVPDKSSTAIEPTLLKIPEEPVLPTISIDPAPITLDETADVRAITPDNSQQEINELDLTPTRKKNGGSILKSVPTPSNPNKNKVIFSENHLEISTHGDKSVNKIIPDTKDTRKQKKRLRSFQGCQSPNFAQRNVTPSSNIGSTPGPKGFLSRGLAMFQAATQLTPNATKRRNDQLSPHRQPLRQQIINQLSPNAKRPHLDVVLEDEKKSPKPSPKNSPLKNDKVVKSPVKIPESKQPETKSESSNVKNKNENIVDDYILYAKFLKLCILLR